MSFFLPTAASRLVAGPSCTRPLFRFVHATPPSTTPTRHAIGRITPRRIAIPVPGGGARGDGMPKASVVRPILFCIGIGAGGYIFAAQYTNLDTERWMKRLGAGSVWRLGKSDPSDRELARAKRLEQAKLAQETVNKLPKTLSFLPNFLLVPILRTYIVISEYRLNTPPAQVAPVGLIIVMGGVFLAWKVNAWEKFMKRWFLHRPVLLGARQSKEWISSVTLLTSTMSHQSLAHFAFNSIALYSFGAAAYDFISLPVSTFQEQPTSTHTPHFLAFLLLAGLASSLSSHLFTNIVRLPRLLRTLANPARLSSAQALAAHQAILPSLGASGAIYACLSMTALAFPDSHVSIVFLPFISIPIGFGVFGMVALDLYGLIRGWRMFDHVAHLGGAVFGVIYWKYGKQLWAEVRAWLGAETRQSGFYM